MAPRSTPQKPKTAEFFAGIGLARLGLERAGFDVHWANDIEPFKAEMYAGHFRDEVKSNAHQFKLGDIADIAGRDMPDMDMAWASFPCTDLSLAGGRAGMVGKASSTFYHFTRILEEMGSRRPNVVAVENVHGLATSHAGDDMTAAIRALNELGYSVDVLAIDARRFVAQSRPRLFMVGVRDIDIVQETEGSELRPDFLQNFYGDPSLLMHKAALPALPAPLTSGLASEIEVMDDSDSRWWDEDRTLRFTSSLSTLQWSRFASLRRAEGVTYRTAYRRTRNGSAVWEIRADDISGCLRTARGGSSKQAVVRLGNGKVQVRWMTPLEYARLMGAGDYELSGLRDSQILFGFGDAVCAPAVEWVGKHYLAPALAGELSRVRELSTISG